MNVLLRKLTSRRVVLFTAVPLVAIAVAALALFAMRLFDDSPVSAQDTACGQFQGQDLRNCLVRQALVSGNLGIVEEAIDQAEAIATTGLVPLDSSVEGEGIGLTANGSLVLEETSQLRQKVVSDMTAMANSLGQVGVFQGIPDEVKSRAFRTELTLRTIADVINTVSPITSQCVRGMTIAHPDDPTNPDPASPCNQLLPLTSLDKVSDENPFVIMNADPIDKFTTFGLFPSYSVPLKADLVPPRWSREIPELVKPIDAMAIGE